ncbi:MAG: GNAT family N-acetyltransferase [Brevefilum sp.]|nr:GNAT family N-acetyltransferase [Brevefilum sp.]
MSPTLHTSDPIRKIDLAHDLNPVADLIELCFPIHLDPDGKTYVTEMRKAARDMRMMGWLSNVSDLETGRTSGFVWEEDGRIVGNLSLVPLRKDGRRVYLIANVAVHPDFRRQGIARKLTQRALMHLAQQRESEVWLQVRDDNPPAITLYRSLGFIDQAARTTWRIRPADFQSGSVTAQAGLSVRRRLRGDWEIQRDELEAAYPRAIRWNLPVNFRRFEPGVLQAISNVMEGALLKHWAVCIDGKCQGVITWQKSDSYANNLWLAFPDGRVETLLPFGLGHVMRHVPKNHPLSIDYPKSRFEEALRDLGFFEFRTLIWMRRKP